MNGKISTIPCLVLLILLGVECANAQTDTFRPQIGPRSVGINGNTYTIFQAPSPLRKPSGDEKNIYPFYQYFNFDANSPENGLSFNTFFRYRDIFNGEDESLDVYNAFLEFKNIANTFDIRFGRQIITESVNYLLIDGGLVRFRPIEGIELVAYGGYQEDDIQPEPEQPTSSFGVIGFKLKTDLVLDSMISLGYELYDPDDFSPRHTLSFSFNRVVPFTDYADLYSLVEFDLEEGNFGLFTVGVSMTPLRTLYLNLEYNSYEIDEQDNEFQFDPIFDLFSSSRMQQAKIGITYRPIGFLEFKTSYAYTRYDVLGDDSTNGNVLRASLSWDFWQELGLKAFQGFYLISSRTDDYARGFNLGISEEIIEGLLLHATFDYVNFFKITNQEGDAYSYIMGAEYVLSRDIVLKAELEINSNPIFDDDVRTNLGISYYF